MRKNFRLGRKCVLGNCTVSQDLIEVSNYIRDRRQEISMSQEKIAEESVLTQLAASGI